MKAFCIFSLLLFGIQLFSQGKVDTSLNLTTFNCFDKSAKLDTSGKIYIHGTVFTKHKNLPVPGVKVMVEGTNIECITNNVGYFLLDLNNISGKNTGYVLISAHGNFPSQKVFVGKSLSKPETLNMYL